MAMKKISVRDKGHVLIQNYMQLGDDPDMKTDNEQALEQMDFCGHVAWRWHPIQTIDQLPSRKR